jgi:hypothetical protein
MLTGEDEATGCEYMTVKCFLAMTNMTGTELEE